MLMFFAEPCIHLVAGISDYAVFGTLIQLVNQVLHMGCLPSRADLHTLLSICLPILSNSAAARCRHEMGIVLCGG